MGIILGSLQTSLIQGFRGSFGCSGAIIPVQTHVNSSSLFPSLGAAGSYSINPVNTLNTHYKAQREAAHTSGSKGFSLPMVFSFLNFSPKRQRYLFGEFENRQGHKSNLFLFVPPLTLNYCSASLLLSQSSVCIPGNSEFTNIMFGNYASMLFIIMA